MGNWVLETFKHKRGKEEKIEVLGADKKVKGTHLQDLLGEDYAKQVKILSDSNLAEKLTEMDLAAKGKALDAGSGVWPETYLKYLKEVEKNRKSAEDKLLKLLKGDFSMLEERVKGEVESAEKKISEQDAKSKKSEEVPEKKYDTGRKIVSFRDKVRKVALKNSPWKVTKDEEGKEVIVGTEDKDAFISEESKKKIKKGK